MSLPELLVLTADADAEATLSAVLQRPQALGIRAITAQVKRHVGRDCGMVTNGPEIARLHKGRFQKIILLWDHYGSGWEEKKRKKTPAEAEATIADRLDRVTWQGHSAAVVLDPELEVWLWHDRDTIATHLGIPIARLDHWVAEYAGKRGLTPERVTAEQPKELFAFVCVQKQRRSFSPADFRRIAEQASLGRWRACPSFAALCAQLARWPPPSARLRPQPSGSRAKLLKRDWLQRCSRG